MTREPAGAHAHAGPPPARSPNRPLPGVVDVWRVALDPSPDEESAQVQFLDPGERARADRFRFDRDRRRYVAAHGGLRRLLAAYLGCPPDAVPLAADAHGKPCLAPRATAGEGMFFNLSHAGDLAIVALAADRPLGVDVERVRSMDDLDRLTRRCCTEAEREAIRTRSGGERTQAFLRCWTRKEALLKGWGRGMALPLEALNADPGFVPHHRLPPSRAGGVETRGWTVVEIAPAPGYVGAVAAPGAFRLALWGDA